jgi:hypothetical protein
MEKGALLNGILWLSTLERRQRGNDNFPETITLDERFGRAMIRFRARAVLVSVPANTRRTFFAIDLQRNDVSV